MSEILTTKKPIRCDWCEADTERAISIEGVGTLCLHHFRVAMSEGTFTMDAKVQGIHDVNFHKRTKVSAK